LEKWGKDEWESARESRRNDLLVYLALSNFRRLVPYRHLSQSLQQDFRAFFGTYQSALLLSRELLFAAGDPHKVEQVSQSTRIGWQDEQALYFHRTVLEKLPPLLRVYVGCASVL
jgi:DNA phosphorothioation-associated putative methyltransferase